MADHDALGHSYRCGMYGPAGTHDPEFVCDCQCHKVPESTDLAPDHDLQMAQYRELHDRLEDFVVWMTAQGYLARNAISPPDDWGQSADHDNEHLFEFIEAYLDQANEHEHRGPLDQILQPDMSELSGEPE